jgi:uncharacterized cysteine cluster protein YcgN (CxxCxxCC family)
MVVSSDRTKFELKQRRVTLKSNRKYYSGLCQRCGESGVLVLLQKDKEREILRLRCSKCSTANEFSFRRVLRTGRVLTEKEYEDMKI